MKKKKIFIIIPKYKIGGAEKVMVGIANELTKFAEKFTLGNFSNLNTQRPYFLKNPQSGGGQIELDAEL